MAPVSMPNRAFTVGWICALPTERAAATTMLDEFYQELQEQHQADTNQCVLGRIKSHCVVIAYLPAGEYGLASAAAAAQQMLSSFPTIRFGLLIKNLRFISGPLSRAHSNTAWRKQMERQLEANTVDEGLNSATGKATKPHYEVLIHISEAELDSLGQWIAFFRYTARLHSLIMRQMVMQ